MRSSLLDDAPVGITDDNVMMWGMLPSRGFIRDYIDTHAPSTAAGLMLQIASALGVLSSLAPPTLATERYGSAVPGVVWPVIVGGSGTFKTTVMGHAESILANFPKYLIGEPKSEKGMLKWFYRQAYPKRRTRGEEESHVVVAAEAYPRGTVLYRDMGATFLTSSFGQNSMLASLRTCYTNMFDMGHMNWLVGDDDECFSLPYARLTVFGATTPSHVENFTNENDWAGGFCARPLWLAGLRRPEEPSEADMIIDRQALLAKLDILLKRPVVLCGGLTPAATAAYKEASKENNRATASTTAELQGLFGRVDAFTTRCALLHAWASRDDLDIPNWRLSLDDINWGIAVVRCSLLTAVALQRGLSLDTFQRNRRRLLAFIRTQAKEGSGRVVTHTDIVRLLKLKKRDVDDIVSALTEEKRILINASGDGERYYTATVEAAEEDERLAVAEVKRAQDAMDRGVCTPGMPELPPRFAAPPVPGPLMPDRVSEGAPGHSAVHIPYTSPPEE